MWLNPLLLLLCATGRLLSSYFYCCQKFTMCGSCPSVQSKRFGPFGSFAACLGELKPEGFSTSGPACSFPKANGSWRIISCGIKTGRHSGTKSWW